MTILYGITFIAALVMLPIYYQIDRKRNIWLILMFCFVAMINGGYLLLSLSRTLTTALLANTVTYLGNVFLPFFLLMMIVRLSYLRYPKWLPILLILLNTGMFLIATSGGYSSVYYKEVSLEIVNGTAHLVKTYGPLHGLYKIFLFGYFGAMVGVICYTAVKKTAVSTKHTVFLAFVMISNIALWLVENITRMQFECLSITYLMTEGLILLLYGILQDCENPPTAVEPEDLTYADADGTAETEISGEGNISAEHPQAFSEEQIKQLFSIWTETHTLTQRETEVLRFILEKRKRKDIAQVLFVTESTIKKHTSNIYKKLEVANRNELYEKAYDLLQ